MASILVQNLSLQYQMERPGFAAVLLGADLAAISALLQQNQHDLFAQQISALGNSGDVLVVFSHGNAPANIVKAIQAAHSKDMVVVCFSGTGDENLTASLAEQDCHVQVNHSDKHRVNEIHLLVISALCDLIDYQIFGGIYQ